MKCFFDKSDGVDDAGDEWLTLVGFAASDGMWRKFEDLWRRVLWERYPIAPYLHMTHLLSGEDPFERGCRRLESGRTRCAHQRCGFHAPDPQ